MKLMPLIYFCNKCQQRYSHEEFNKNRFCIKCGKYLSKEFVTGSDKHVFPAIVLDNELKKIANFIVRWYERKYSENRELENRLLQEINADTIEGRFEVVMLATLFSEYAMREERAYKLWWNIKNWRDSNGYKYLEIFSKKNEELSQEFYKLAHRISLPSKFPRKMWWTLKNLEEYGGDLNGLINPDSWYFTLQNIIDNCNGIRQKAFWIARVMRQKQAWDIPRELCCVSDSHNKALLLKTDFVKSTDDLFHNSRIMWKYFNEPFAKHHYDLSIFRFARDHSCKKCDTKYCSLEILQKCKK